ncbi:MAG: SIS domain-containing protein [Patescibacteria group bacterium]
MERAIRNIKEQFLSTLIVQNPEKLEKASSLIVGGMGGSNLASGLYAMFAPEIPILIHRDYGIPSASPKKEGALAIASSYSGNTEEALDFARTARGRGFAISAITSGGALLSMARKFLLPHVVLPGLGIQPRVALPLSIRAIAMLAKNDRVYGDITAFGNEVDPNLLEEKGRDMASLSLGKIPIIYSSLRNAPLSYIWKIKLNETGKVPAFSNTFPEINHNEIEGFDYSNLSHELSEKFYFIFLKDEADHASVRARMDLTKELLVEKRFLVTILDLAGKSQTEKIFNNIILADWASLYTARAYDSDPEAVPLIESLKKRLARMNVSSVK